MAAGSPSNSSRSSSADPGGETVLVPWTRVERFIGQFIHDVRNGLNAIELQLTFLGEISTDPEAVEEVKRLRGTLLDVTRQLQGLKTVSSPVVPHVLEYPAADLLEDLRERLERLHPIAAKRVQWDLAVGPEASLFVDPDLSINGLLELFANAFRSAATELRCTTADEPQHLLFVLNETPVEVPGIPPERWGHEPLLSDRRGAYGLGLFRFRRILESQGGTLRVHYAASDQRLTTTVGLPRRLRTEGGLNPG